MTDLLDLSPEDLSYALLRFGVEAAFGRIPMDAFRFLWFSEEAVAAKTFLPPDVVTELDLTALQVSPLEACTSDV